MLISEFKELAKPIFTCSICNKAVSGLEFNTFANIILHQNGISARKLFDEKTHCAVCLKLQNLELFEKNEGGIEQYFKEKRQERINAMTPEEKKLYEDEKAWRKAQNQLQDVDYDGETKHHLDKYTYVTDHYLSMILSSAFESGIYGAGIWARIVKETRPIQLKYRRDKINIYPHIDYVLNEGGSITLWDFEEFEEQDPNGLHELTKEKLISGFEKAYALFVVEWDDPTEYKSRCLRDQEDIDGELADCIIQFAIFGEIRYS